MPLCGLCSSHCFNSLIFRTCVPVGWICWDDSTKYICQVKSRLGCQLVKEVQGVSLTHCSTTCKNGKYAATSNWILVGIYCLSVFKSFWPCGQLDLCNLLYISCYNPQLFTYVQMYISYLEPGCFDVPSIVVYIEGWKWTRTCWLWDPWSTALQPTNVFFYQLTSYYCLFVILVIPS